MEVERWRTFPSAKRVGVTPRDFGVAARVPNGNNVLLFGGFDGHGWLNDLHVLDVATGEWRAVAVPVAPSPRSGHAGDVVDSRVLLFGGQASNGQLCGDLWALRDPDTDPIARDADALVDILDGRVTRRPRLREPTGADRRGGPARRRETRAPKRARESPAGRVCICEASPPSPHGPFRDLRGKQGAGVRRPRRRRVAGEAARYYDDAHAVDREPGKWRRLNASRDRTRDLPRAFHTMTKVGDALLLLGGFTGETALGDAVVRVREEDAGRRD